MPMRPSPAGVRRGFPDFHRCGRPLTRLSKRLEKRQQRLFIRRRKLGKRSIGMSAHEHSSLISVTR